MRRWLQVTRANPCPICGKPSWCAITSDRTWVTCRRVDDVAAGCISRQDRNGQEYYLYCLDGEATEAKSSRLPDVPIESVRDLADPDTLNQIYSALISACVLRPEHLQHLLARGLTEAVIAQNEYRTLPERNRADVAADLADTFGNSLLARVPGFFRHEKGGRWSMTGKAGLLIPVRDFEGRVVAFKIRQDDPENTNDRYRWLTSTHKDGPGPGSPAHLPLRSQVSTTGVVRLTEGELKADVATALSGILTVSAPGATNWRVAIPIIEATEARVVLLTLDKDWETNPHVARALKLAGDRLMELGLEVWVEGWEGVKGIDDALAAGKVIERIPYALVEIPQEAVTVERMDPEQENLTDLGNALRFVRQHGEDIRYVHLWDRWMVWDGTRWKSDDTAAIRRKAVDTVRTLYEEANRTDDEKIRRALLAHAVKSESTGKISAFIEAARSLPRVPATPHEWDADASLFACRNGVLDLRTGCFQNHSRSDRLTKVCPVVFQPNATSPEWSEFLASALPEPAVRQFLQRAVGYTLTGDISEEVFFFLYGGTGTGKSTFLNTIIHLLGDYAARVSFETLLSKQMNSTAEREIVKLVGKRMAVGIEVGRGERMAVGLLKQMTGGDYMSARFLFKECFDFMPTHKLWLAANDHPHVPSTDDAMWRRLLQIPFVQRPESVNLQLKDKLREERVLSAILNWALEGCLEWKRIGLAVPDSVRGASASYRSEMDPLEDWLGECCIIKREAWVSTSSLYASYTEWCRLNGERFPMGRRGLQQALEHRGFKTQQHGELKLWHGIRLRTAAESLMYQTVNGEGAVNGTVRREVTV